MSIPERFVDPCKSELLGQDCAVQGLSAEPLDMKFCKDVVVKNNYGLSMYESMQQQAAILKKNVWDQGQTILIAFLNFSFDSSPFSHLFSFFTYRTSLFLSIQ